MQTVPFIDFHTHREREEKDTITVRNLFPGDAIAAFSGRNFYSVGLHPWHLKSKEKNDELLRMVEDALEIGHVVFVGECGLDKAVETGFEEQIRVFRAQAFMAEEAGKPLIVHCVRAYGEIIEVYRKMRPRMPWVLHGYNGSVAVSEQLAKTGMLFSFGKLLFNEKSKAVQSFRVLPLERIFFETDEFEGNVKEIYEKGAVLKNVSPGFLMEAVWNNFNRIERSLLRRF